MKKIIAITIASMMAAPISSFAATGSASFAGTVDSTCVITAGNPGRITPNADYSNLSSANAGGYGAAVLCSRRCDGAAG